MKAIMVKFKNGKYGYRSWFFGYRFESILTSGVRWRATSNIEMFCQGTKKEWSTAIAERLALSEANRERDIGIPVLEPQP